MVLGIGDDCAIVSPPAGSEVLVTTDLLLEGRHFRRDLHAPASAGHRCLARGLSDLAAMGATPLAAFLSLALPAGEVSDAAGRRWLGGFLGGMAGLARAAGVPLAGGDTGESAGELLMADIVLVGSAPRGSAMRRSGARVGDAIYVTGALGGAAAELERMLAGGRALPRARSPQRFPAPRVRVGVALRELGVRCAIDLSDGLSSDLGHVVRSSGVRAVVEAEALPRHALLRGRPREEALRLALDRGEDYELLFTAAAGLNLPEAIDGVPLTRIGEIAAAGQGRPPVTLRLRDGREEALAAGGWEHFSGRGSVRIPARRSGRAGTPTPGKKRAKSSKEKS